MVYTSLMIGGVTYTLKYGKQLNIQLLKMGSGQNNAFILLYIYNFIMSSALCKNRDQISLTTHEINESKVVSESCKMICTSIFNGTT